MSRTYRRGLTLTEVLVVFAIIAIALSLMFPATRRVRGAAGRMTCANNLKQLVLALHSAHDASDRPVSASTEGDNQPSSPHFPTGCSGPGSVPEDRLSWTVTILPFLEQESTYKQFDTRLGYADNHRPVQTAIKTFLCPDIMVSFAGAPVTHYVAMSGIGPDAATRPAGAAGNGFMGYDRLTSLATIKDGASNTVALLETKVDVGPWARGGTSTVRGFEEPREPVKGTVLPFGGHTTGTQAAMADGSVRFIRTDSFPTPLAAAITIAGGEEVNLD